MSDLKNRVVSPSTDPDRWTPEEREYYARGLCSWDVGVQYFGRTDHLCGQRSRPDATFGYCPQHEQQLLEDHWPDGSRR